MYDRDVIIPLFDSDLQPFLSKFCMSVHPNLILPMCDGCSRKLFLSKARTASLFCQFRSPEPEMSSPEVGNWKATNNRRRQTGTSRRGEKAK